MVKKAKAAREEQSEDAVLFARRAEELRLSGDALFAQGKCVATRSCKGGHRPHLLRCLLSVRQRG